MQGCAIFVSLVQLSRILQAPGLNATHRNIFCSTKLVPPTHGRIDIPFRPTQNGEPRIPRPPVTALSTFQPTTLYFSVLNSHSQYTSHLDIQPTETAGSSAPSLAPRKFSGCGSWDWIRMLICCQPFLTTRSMIFEDLEAHCICDVRYSRMGRREFYWLGRGASISRSITTTRKWCR